MNLVTEYFTEINDDESKFISQLKVPVAKVDLDMDCILVKMNDISKASKIQLRRIISEHSEGIIILCSYNLKVLAFSTGIRVIHAFNLIDWKHSMKGLSYKLTLLKKVNSGECLSFYYNGGLVNLRWSNICCIKGSGNYCRIYAHGKKAFLVTMRIKEIREKISEEDMFFDVNRSYIVNINRIAAVRKQSVTFRSTPKYVLKMGYRSAKKVKDELLWINDKSI